MSVLRKRRRNGLILALALAGGIAALWTWKRSTPEHLLERGLVAARRDPAAGERLVRRALENAGGEYPDAELALSVIRGAREEQTPASSRVSFESCRSDILLAYSRAALESGQQREARLALEVVRGRGTRASVQALERLIVIFADSGSPDELIAAARDLTRLEPANPRSWRLLIDTLGNQVRHEPECLDAIRRALEQDLPDAWRDQFKYRLVGQLIVCGDAAEARRRWEELARKNGESLKMQLYEIDILRLEGKLDEALESMNAVFQTALSAPDSPLDRGQAHFSRGVIYLDMVRFEEARDDLEQAIAADPANASARFKLSEALRGLGLLDDARRQREIAIALGEKKDRVERLTKAAAHPGDAGRACEELAELFEEFGDVAAARVWRNRAAKFGVPAPDR